MKLEKDLFTAHPNAEISLSTPTALIIINQERHSERRETVGKMNIMRILKDV